MFKFRCIKSSELPIKVTIYKQFMQHLVKIFYPRDFHFPVPRNKYSIDALVGTHCQFGGLSNNIYLASIDFVGMILVSRTVALSLSLFLYFRALNFWPLPAVRFHLYPSLFLPQSIKKRASEAN